jgi:hypothetical protein
MKLKNTLAAVSLAMAVSGASASDIYLGTLPVANDTDMDNLTVGTFTVTETSKIDGLLYYIPTAVVPGLNISIPFSSATFAAASLFSGGFEKYHVESGAAFSFSNVVAGTYELQIDGDTGHESSLGSLIGAKLSVSAVPEPDSYAMLLAGVGLMGLWPAVGAPDPASAVCSQKGADWLLFCVNDSFFRRWRKWAYW